MFSRSLAWLMYTRSLPNVINPRMTRSVGFWARRGILYQLVLFVDVKNLAGLEDGYILRYIFWSHQMTTVGHVTPRLGGKPLLSPNRACLILLHAVHVVTDNNYYFPTRDLKARQKCILQRVSRVVNTARIR